MTTTQNNKLGYNVHASSFASFDGRPELDGIVVRCATRQEAETIRAEMIRKHGYVWEIATITVPSGIGPEDSMYGFGGGLG